MSGDPIVDELHRQRRQRVEAFDFNYDALYEDMKAWSREKGIETVRRAPQTPLASAPRAEASG